MKRRILLPILCLLTFIQVSVGQTKAKAFAAPTGPNALEVEGTDKTFFSEFLQMINCTNPCTI